MDLITEASFFIAFVFAVYFVKTVMLDGIIKGVKEIIDQLNDVNRNLKEIEHALKKIDQFEDVNPKLKEIEQSIKKIENKLS